jgi:acetolactate synthase I/II/III large subunit
VDSQSQRGADILVRALVANQVDLAFGVPGESFLAVLDAFVDAPAMRFVTTRHEGGAAFMAEAYGKLTGRPGICFVTRGPGATNASIGVHTAQQDSTPMIVFVGQVARGMMEREAFQEVDYRAVFGSVAKWVAQIDDAARIPEFVSRAFHTALSGRPGPVVLALPEDMLSGQAKAPDPAPAVRLSLPAPGPDDMAAFRGLLEAAERPLVVAGGGGWSAKTASLLGQWSEREGLPVALEFRCQDYLDNAHPCYVGDAGIAIAPSLAERIRASDCLILLGSRMGEMPTSGYQLITIPHPQQTLVHIHPDAAELGRVYYPDLPINAAAGRFLSAALAGAPLGRAEAWAPWRREARAAHEATSAVPPGPGVLDLAEVVRILHQQMPEDTIITNGAGNYTVWVHKLWQHRRYRTQLAPVSGAMGYGVPAAVAAALVHPDRPVVCFAGDGCFLMTGQELATAVRHRLPILFIVVNNGMFGTIRMHQERHYPARVSATDLTNPDFADYARAFGAEGFVVEHTADFSATLEKARCSAGPALIELRVDPEALTLRDSLSKIRERAQLQAATSHASPA